MEKFVEFEYIGSPSYPGYSLRVEITEGNYNRYGEFFRKTGFTKHHREFSTDRIWEAAEYTQKLAYDYKLDIYLDPFIIAFWLYSGRFDRSKREHFMANYFPKPECLVFKRQRSLF